MDRFSECALFVIGCDAAFAAIAAAISMFAFSFDPYLALNIGAGIALFFCLRLIWRWSQVQKKGVCHTMIWQIMDPEELPREARAIHNAQDRMEELLLRFAKGSSAVSIALCSAAILISLN